MRPQLATLLTFALALAATTPAPAHAQRAGRWKQIGTTSVGNPVFLDPRTVKRENGIVTALVRVTFNEPVKTPKGEITASRTVAMFDCAKRRVAVKENTYYVDERRNLVYQHSAPKIPGYSSPIKGTLPDVALRYFCALK